MGRFLTVDSARYNLRDPQSFNRYAYSQGDPVNRYDPSGRFSECADEFLSYDVCAPWGTYIAGTVAEYDDTYGSFLAQITKEKREFNKEVLEAFAAAAAVAAQQAQKGLAYPAYLQVVGDRYTCWGKAVEREVSYQLYDDWGRPMSSGVITEHLLPTDGRGNVIDKPAPNTSSGLPTGRFDDTISIQLGPPRTYYQTFTVNGRGSGPARDHEHTDFRPRIWWRLQDTRIYKTATEVVINGDRGKPIDCSNR